MKKVLGLILVAGLVGFTSCSSDPNDVKAQEFCDCFAIDTDIDMAELEAQLEAMENGDFGAMDGEIAKQDECVETWKAKHNISKDDINFRVALKNMSPSMYRKAVDRDICD